MATNNVEPQPSIQNPARINWKRAAFVIIPLALIGLFFIFRSFAASPLAIKVAGNKFVDQNGATVQLHGVNRSGLEFSCVQQNTLVSGTGSGYDGSSPDYAHTIANALDTWELPGKATRAINAVRIPLNESCWLGNNGVNTNVVGVGGSKYRLLVSNLVSDLTAKGIYPILDLHWTAPGSYLAGPPCPPKGCQDVAANEENSRTFWKQVATAYKDNAAVMFDLMNEPRVWCNSGGLCPATDYNGQRDWAWNLYRKGGLYKLTLGDFPNDIGPSEPARYNQGVQMNVAGIETIVSDIRTVGSNNVVLVEGLGYGNSTDGFLPNRPADPKNQMAFSTHLYTGSGANINNESYLNGGLDPIAAVMPIYVGEVGNDSDLGSDFTSRTIDWANRKGYSYTIWDFEKNAGPSLISNNETGAPTVFGNLVKPLLQAYQTGTGTVDSTKPTVSLTAPANAATVTGGAVTLSANASDNVGVTRVEFMVDSATVNTDTASPYAYSWNSQSVANGTHTVTTTAYDAAGNSNSSAATVTVNNPAAVDNVKPTVSLTAPANGATVTGGAVTLSANASDNVGVTKVEFSVNGTVVSTDTTSPYSYSWNSQSVANGGYTVTAKAFDAAGNTNTSSAAATVNNTTPPPVDNLQPNAYIQTPATNATVSGNLAVTGTADGTGSVVSSVKICASCTSEANAVAATVVRSGNTATWSYTLNTTGIANGPASIIAWVTDGSNNKGGATVPVTIQNGDTQAPNVSGVNLLATAASSTKVHLSWVAATDNVGVTGYYVIRGGTTIAQVGAVTSYDDTAVVANTTYSYQLIAFDARGNNSAKSTAASATTPQGPDTFAPSVPVGLTATVASQTQINLKWNASTDTGGSGLKGYDVYRNGTKLNNSPVTTTSYGSTNLTPATTYSYYVKAVDGAGNVSAASLTVSATTSPAVIVDGQKPIWPTGSKVTLDPVDYQWWRGPCGPATGCSQNISWSAAVDDVGVVGYTVRRAINGGTPVIIASIKATQRTYRDAPVSNGTTYTYTIVGRDAAGNRTAGLSVTKKVSCILWYCQ